MTISYSVTWCYMYTVYRPSYVSTRQTMGATRSTAQTYLYKWEGPKISLSEAWLHHAWSARRCVGSRDLQAKSSKYTVLLGCYALCRSGRSLAIYFDTNVQNRFLFSTATLPQNQKAWFEGIWSHRPLALLQSCTNAAWRTLWKNRLDGYYVYIYIYMYIIYIYR